MLKQPDTSNHQGTGIKAWRWILTSEPHSLVDVTTLRHTANGTVGTPLTLFLYLGCMSF